MKFSPNQTVMHTDFNGYEQVAIVLETKPGQCRIQFNADRDTKVWVENESLRPF